MPKSLKADDILPLVASLTPRERARLLSLIASAKDSDLSTYVAISSERDEFKSDDDLLAWDAEGWEQFS